MVTTSPSCLKLNPRAVTKNLRPSSPKSEQNVTGRAPSPDPRNVAGPREGKREIASHGVESALLCTRVRTHRLPNTHPRLLIYSANVQQAL